jgi:hypothetical protein
MVEKEKGQETVPFRVKRRQKSFYRNRSLAPSEFG